ncbi:GNAT family N-acetyltransferase [Macrococcus lamae]|uniref:GNAT family N-acetyltransferase n=1 Tax=Macrococcus lamae TaxID=198484 RepID=A0A4R6BU42_9STAP|nr:GNAT family N-acetyltransferase [Macrococcus lamae]TDM07938.1 GNAT family N-acetyltransferase [Macrococcus lamae]
MKLVKYDETMIDQLNQYELTEAQLKFVKSPAVKMKEAETETSMQLVLGLNENEEAVVFFVLDTDSEFRQSFEVEPYIYVSSFSTDHRHLRKGYATAALQALPGFVNTYYPDVEWITLIVDEPNAKAKDMYIKQGFELGLPIHGPRHPGFIMKKQIK